MTCREPFPTGSLAVSPHLVSRRRLEACATLRAGMTRVDVLFTVLGIGVLVLLAWAGVSFAGEPRRIWLCKHHLRTLSDAFAQYAHDNAGAIPPAVLDDGTNTTTWDAEIAPYLVSASARKDLASDPQKLHQRVAGGFACPSDAEPRGGQATRSYSMPMYDVKKESWPPDSDAQEGVGLFLDVEHLKLARQAMSTEPTKFVPRLNKTMIPAPADTALLVERISIRNALWSSTFACIIAPREQWDAKTLKREKFHGGKFNYLMLDGHVELLTERQSGGHIGNGGVWTIRAGD